MSQQYCYWQCKCSDDTKDSWTCQAHLAEGRAFKCSYSSNNIKEIGGKTIMSHQGFGLGQCQDWQQTKQVQK